MTHRQPPHHHQRWVGVLLWCALFLPFVSACSTPTTVAPTATPAPTSATTLVVWHALGGSDEYAYSAVLQAAATTSGVTLVLQRMPLSSIATDVETAWKQNRGPHLALLHNNQLPGLAASDAALPLDALLPVPIRERIPANLRATTQATDRSGQMHWYGVPVRYSLPVLFYNTRAVLQVPTTTADLFTVGRALHNPPEWGFGTDLSVDTMGGYLTAHGGSVVDDRGRVTLGGSGRPGAEAWLAWLAARNNDPELLARLNGVFLVERAVGAGQLAMVVDHSDRVDTYRRVWGDHVGVAALPTLSETGQAPTPTLQSSALVVNQHLSTAEARATQAFLTAFLDPSLQAQLATSGYQPVITGVPFPSGSVTAAIATAAAGATATAPALLRYDVQRVMQTAVRQVLAGVVSPADAITSADSQLRLLLEGTDQP